ncbi:MAG: hypothetical protein R2843_05590 [Thermomicrobiales bacterium]
MFPTTGQVGVTEHLTDRQPFSEVVPVVTDDPLGKRAIATSFRTWRLEESRRSLVVSVSSQGSDASVIARQSGHLTDRRRGGRFAMTTRSFNPGAGNANARR